MSRLHELGCVFQMVPAAKEGWISAKAFAEMITPRTAMLSISWANGLTGVLQPLSEIRELCKERGILLHVEGTHALGKGDFSFEESGADILTFNGPAGGMGGMFIREGVEISPLILGGKEQGGMRGGFFNPSLLIECAKWAKEERSYADHYTIEIARLRSLFEDSLCANISGAAVLFQEQDRLPHISSLVFPGAASDALLFLLNQKGLLATCGGNHFQHITHLLKACELPEPNRHTAVSFAFSHTTTEEEIEEGVAILIESVRLLRNYSEHMLRETV
jgi:cysteine desulfurase